MSDFEQWVRTSMAAAVADAEPPDAVMELVRRRHRQHNARLAASVVAVAVLLIAAAPLARAWHRPDPATSRPVSGGTLKIVAISGPDHLDPVPAYYSADTILERAYTRQLVTYRTVPDPSLTSVGWKTDITPIADLATELPSVRNGGISAGGRIYTFHIRPGADWDTSPPRQVAAADFIREFKSFCNPTSTGFVGNLGYYTATIVGLASYCHAENSYFASGKHPATATGIAAFQNSHAISGLVALNQLTLRFRLLRSASDLEYLLALPFASARPVEYDRYLPDSLRLDEHIVSDGPYSITSYLPGKLIVLRRNPAWKRSTDPARHQYAKEITVTIGVTNPLTQINDLRRGRFDLMLDAPLPPGALPGLRTSPEFHVWPGAGLLPYLVFNLRSPNSRHAIGHLDVRRAIEFGIDKAAVQQAFGGPLVTKVISSVQPPGNFGSVAANPYPSAGNRGNPAQCQADLARAGLHHGVRLRLLYANGTANANAFAAIRTSLASCGIHVINDPVPPSTYYQAVSGGGRNKPGTYDLALAPWLPDWTGDNGRALLDPLFRTNCTEYSANYGCYSNRPVDRAITDAEAAATPQQAAPFLAEAARQIMADAAAVPLIDPQNPIFTSVRVREAGLRAGVVSAPNTGGPDITNIWLANG